MGILDFREICSPNVNHDSVKNTELGLSNLRDDFELFCQEFFQQVKRFKIFKSVSNGPDMGIDLGVEEITKDGSIRWLVSCKHYAHSNQSVPEHVEQNIIEKVLSWDCQGFIPFYTTAPSSKLSQCIMGAEKIIKVERYCKQRIESELLNNSSGASIAARYFPISMTNHYKHFIAPSTQYTHKDILFENNTASLQNFSITISNNPEKNSLGFDRLVENANISAGFKQHLPYFIQALDDATSLFPEAFIIDKQAKYKPKPTWDPHQLAEIATKHRLSKAYFVAAVWSFWDYRKANDCFTDFMIIRSSPELQDAETFNTHRSTENYAEYHASILTRALLTPGHLGLKLQDKERDIVARLFAFTNSIP